MHIVVGVDGGRPAGAKSGPDRDVHHVVGCRRVADGRRHGIEIFLFSKVVDVPSVGWNIAEEHDRARTRRRDLIHEIEVLLRGRDREGATSADIVRPDVEENHIGGRRGHPTNDVVGHVVRSAGSNRGTAMPFVIGVSAAGRSSALRSDEVDVPTLVDEQPV